MEQNRDKEEDKHTRPGIARPGQQPDQQQQPNAPPQPESQHPPSQSSSLWIPPRTGNPDLDPAILNQSQRIDLRERNPLVPQGMLYDPRQLIDHPRGGSRPDAGLPPGARFDPFGPPDPSQVGPGRGPPASYQFGIPDPDHMQPPGVPQPPPFGGKSLKSPWPPGSRFPPPGGPGGSPFL